MLFSSFRWALNSVNILSFNCKDNRMLGICRFDNIRAASMPFEDFIYIILQILLTLFLNVYTLITSSRLGITECKFFELLKWKDNRMLGICCLEDFISVNPSDIIEFLSARIIEYLLVIPKLLDTFCVTIAAWNS